MKKLTTTLATAICIIMATIDLQAQSWQWARQNTGGCYMNAYTWTDMYNPFVATDVFGNVYVFGTFFCSSISFGSFTISNPGVEGMFLVKYDSVGNVKWLKNIGTESSGGNNYVSGIATDLGCNIYITGSCGDPYFRCGSVTLYKTASEYEVGMFLVKIDSGGNAIWGRSAEGKGAFANIFGFSSISIDPLGYIYVSGPASDSAVFGSNLVYSQLPLNIFIAKYDSSGNAIWAKGISGTPYLGAGWIVSALTTDNLGDVFIACTTISDTIFIGNSTIPIIGDTNSNLMIFIKYNSSGNVLWVKSVDEHSGNIANSVIADVARNFYVSGVFGSTATFDSTTLSGYGHFLLKYNSSGGVLWVKKVDNSWLSIITDDSCNLYMTGNESGNGIGLVKYDSSGNLIWTRNGSCNWNYYTNYSNSASMSPNGSIYLTGYYSSFRLFFGATTLIATDSMAWYSGGGPGSYEQVFNVFLAKLDTNYNNDVEIVARDWDDIAIYPNPSNGVFTIDIPVFHNHVLIIISDLLGRIIETRILASNVTLQQQLNINNYPPGVYFIKVNVDGLIYNKKIIFE